MALNGVAIESDIKAIPSQGSFTDSAGNAADVIKPGWSAGSVTVTPYPKLTVGGRPVIYRAQCTFSFSGQKTNPSPAPPTPVTGTETLVLSAADLGQTRLQGGENDVLRLGDSTDNSSQPSKWGNVIKVVSSRKLRSD
jgi:hypothetical protein